MKKYFLLISLLILFSMAKSQTTSPPPCSSPEISQFDFWVGEWNLTWNDTSKGTNRIEKIMDGCTLHENFYDPALNYKGQSWSVYNPATKLWEQTWVDNQGGYITLTGKFENGEMTLTTQPKKNTDGITSISRMIFFNITPNRLDWRWERSTDNGATWEVNWLIHYERKK